MESMSKYFLRGLDATKSKYRRFLDGVLIPVRFLFPDKWVERLGLTSLRCERMGIVIRHMQGRCLDIGCQDNLLIKTYKYNSSDENAVDSQGVDVFDWGGDTVIIKSSDTIPFPSKSFDTISIVAALNHIPERKGTLKECNRLLKPEGQLLITMISPFIGNISHRIRFWGEHSHRTVQDGELYGLSTSNVIEILKEAGFSKVNVVGFLYGLNNLFIAQK